MTTRTVETTVHFANPFLLPGVDAPQPAGDYRVDHDEESIEAASRLAWRRVGAFLYLPAINSGAGVQQMVPVDPAVLEAALAEDRQRA